MEFGLLSTYPSSWTIFLTIEPISAIARSGLSKSDDEVVRSLFMLAPLPFTASSRPRSASLKLVDPSGLIPFTKFVADPITWEILIGVAVWLRGMHWPATSRGPELIVSDEFQRAVGQDRR